MRYPKFRRQHLFVGSGVIEAGCKTVIGSRLKQSGMFWTVRGANAIIALVLPPQRPLRGLLGGTAGPPDLHFYVAHPVLPTGARPSAGLTEHPGAGRRSAAFRSVLQCDSHRCKCLRIFEIGATAALTAILGREAIYSGKVMTWKTWRSGLNPATSNIHFRKGKQAMSTHRRLCAIAAACC